LERFQAFSDAFLLTFRVQLCKLLLVKLLDDHKNGKADNSRRVWTVYTFLVWYDQFFNDDILNGYAEHTDAKTA